MQAKLFMIPWIFAVFGEAQRDVLTGGPDLLVDAHHRHFHEMLRRQQAINDALLLNNALHLTHPQFVAQLPQIPPAPPATLFNPNPFQLGNLEPASQSSAKGSYGPAAPQELARKTNLAGVKTVHIVKKEEEEEDTVTPTTVPPTSTVPPSDLEMSELFKKLNLTQEETKNIVEHVENLVRLELAKKLREAETSTTVVPVGSTVATATATVPPETTTVLSTTTAVEVMTTSKPKLRLRTLPKHHPIKKEPALPNGAIKTSLTHLPIFVGANIEDDANTNGFEKKQQHILIAANQESDKDLLVDFATGSPLELNEQESLELLPMAAEPISSSSTTTTLAPQTLKPTTVLPRHPNHIPTNFERLASDYRQRLDGTGDLSNIFSKISRNAHISLASARG
ncbi:unnamed protein product [Caenorhabditis angaria]|uniref:Uncharacterized protein n=1 Tax=Caenorhabditis angaria TaxID=860376 RepID=A0A9P1N119_9PELO|nr:unnamed protein product [Caenorhabditis angaria]